MLCCIVTCFIFTTSIRKAYIATIELIKRGKPGELILMNDGIFDVVNVSGHLII